MNIKQSIMMTFAVFSLFSCFRWKTITGSGNIVTEKRELGTFSGVSASGIASVEVKNGPVASVTVEADDNLLPYIDTDVKGGILRVRMKSFSNLKNCTYKVYVTAPAFNKITSSGAANITSNDVIKNETAVSLSSSGAGSMNLSLDAPEVDASSSGAGNTILKGRTRNFSADLSGAGTINSFELLSENATVEVSGAGDIKVHASVKLKAKASGAGGVTYRGAAVVEQKTSGAGNVQKEQ
jgi:Putative auto-transporter adhesin, head GIN domain